jgi:gliding motility-associated-like protein
MITMRYLFTLFLLSVVVPFAVNGQLTADDAFVAETDYPTTGVEDVVFCFPAAADMTIRFENASSGYTYNWFQHDVSTNSWNTPLGGDSDELTVSSGGGYRLVVRDTDNSVVADERCWVYNSQSILNASAQIVFDDCFGVELEASADSVPLIFYDPADGGVGAVQYQLSYSWSTSPAGSEQMEGNPVSFEAPYEDLSYIVTVTDRFGNTSEGSVEYSAIAVEADFEVENLKDTIQHERHSEAEGSAPIEIRFTDQSLGKVSAWQWTFGDAGQSVQQNPLFVFSEAGTDTVTLRVVNRESMCEDLSDPFIVTVRESELEVPNVFTPNGDGVNDEFRVAYKSIKSFKVVIYNRWGRKVYESTDPARGWDGKVGGKIGAPGVYFYNISAEGYNEGETYTKKGTVHLIRSK